MSINAAALNVQCSDPSDAPFALDRICRLSSAVRALLIGLRCRDFRCGVHRRWWAAKRLAWTEIPDPLTCKPGERLFLMSGGPNREATSFSASTETSGRIRRPMAVRRFTPSRCKPALSFLKGVWTCCVGPSVMVCGPMAYLLATLQRPFFPILACRFLTVVQGNVDTGQPTLALQRHLCRDLRDVLLGLGPSQSPSC